MQASGEAIPEFPQQQQLQQQSPAGSIVFLSRSHSTELRRRKIKGLSVDDSGADIHQDDDNEVGDEPDCGEATVVNVRLHRMSLSPPQRPPLTPTSPQAEVASRLRRSRTLNEQRRSVASRGYRQPLLGPGAAASGAAAAAAAADELHGSWYQEIQRRRQEKLSGMRSREESDVITALLGGCQGVVLGVGGGCEEDQGASDDAAASETSAGGEAAGSRQRKSEPSYMKSTSASKNRKSYY